jgi:hypothetical protein
LEPHYEGDVVSNKSTQGNKRVIDQLNVIGSFGDNSKEALRSYIKLHRENKQREMYVVHTSHDQLDHRDAMDKSAGASMKMKIRSGLPFVELVIAHKGMERTISNVLIDSGSVMRFV